MKRVLDIDPETGLRHDFVGHDDGSFSIVTSQDAEAIIESDKTDQSIGKFRLKGDSEGDEWWHVGCIPNIVVMKWLGEGIDVYSGDPDMKKKVARKLNDIEWRWLKSADVRV